MAALHGDLLHSTKECNAAYALRDLFYNQEQVFLK